MRARGKLIKVGHSAAAVIPRNIRDAVGIKIGDHFEYEIYGKCKVIYQPEEPKKEPLPVIKKKPIEKKIVKKKSVVEEVESMINLGDIE